MKTTITRKKVATIKTPQFTTDSLYSFYDFTDDKVGEVIFGSDFIFRFHNKELLDTDEISKAEALLNFIKTLDIISTLDIGERNYNFIVRFVGGKILVQIGCRCAEIKQQLDDYVKYLEDLKTNGMETRIDFEIENEDKIKEYDEYDEY